MSSMIRSMQREMIRQKCYKRDGNTKSFHSEWEKFHNPRVETIDADGNMTSKIKHTQKRKRTHIDNGKVFIKQFKAFKQFLNGLVDAKKTDAEAVTKASN